LIHPREQARRWRPATIVLAIFVAAVLLIGLIAGLALDDRLGTRPIATLLCSLTAAHIAFIVVFRRVSTALREIAEAGRDQTDNDNRGAS
jgi:F0F1-type ATP synthase assembly protein I